MSKKNIVVFSQPRSGTTALTYMLCHTHEEFLKHDTKHWSEFFNVTDTFFPIDNDSGRVWWSTEVEQVYWFLTYSKLEEFFVKHEDHFTNHHFHNWIIKDNYLSFDLIPWEERAKYRSNLYIADKHFKKIELEKRIKLLHSVDSYCFRWFPFHTQEDKWIDYDNTIVIILVRNNVLEKMASHLRLALTGLVNNAQWKRRPWTWEQSKLGPTPPMANVMDDIDPDISIPPIGEIINHINEAKIIEHSIERKQFINRVQNMKADAIISYETLIERGILNRSGFKKITTEPIEIFYENFAKAKEMVADVKPIQDKNIELIEDLLEESING